MPDAVMLFERFSADANRFDFFQAVRLVECAHPMLPRTGASMRPRDDAVRFVQEPELIFFPTTLKHFANAQEAAPKLAINFFGLLGPNGPMPMHLTEYARDRARNAADPTFARFLDVFHHRMASLFYRAWAAAQPAVSLDRDDDDRMSAYVGTTFGLNEASLRNRDAVPDFAKLHFAGLLSGPTRHAAGLRLVLARYFGLPVNVTQNVGHWMKLPAHSLSRLGASDDGARMGVGTMLGARVFDRQHKFRVVLGPLSMRDYERFLPGGASLTQLVDWVRLYVRDPLDWDVNLQLQRADVPRLALGRHRRLGYTTWLHARAAVRDATQLMLRPLASSHAKD
ncbi:type VI secretion protein [Caballeronia novacaledonica]|uniref:Type VI secretion protein n=1 Tax=Caballeronia novacaledonica TaxID=1544861 RepID=A0A2U3I134_9BURK|nr:type VI secretion system baseplate subunit TssG [Caballeronia novacaledonica]SPB13811.1 type VI secretion protein [Caballeronia novacaledonica]